jgi:hypothetical protein
LIEQRLEKMMIVLIDHGDVDWRIREGFRGRQSAEAGTHDHESRPVRHV